MLRIDSRLRQQAQELRENVQRLESLTAEIRQSLNEQKERDAKDLDFQAKQRDATTQKGRPS